MKNTTVLRLTAAILLVTVLSGTGMAFASTKEDKLSKFTFIATVLENNSTHLSVAPDSSSDMAKSNDKFDAPIDKDTVLLDNENNGISISDIEVNDVIEITCGDGILEIYPPRLQKVYQVKIISDSTDSEQASLQQQTAFKMLKSIRNKEPIDENILFSPLSLECAMGMLLLGTAGESRAEIQAALGLADEEVNKYLDNARALTETCNTPESPIQLGNALFSKKGVSIKDEYIQNLKSYFLAEHFPVDSFSTDTIRMINAWVSENTYGQINRIFNENDNLNGTNFMLINALHMALKWDEPFDPERTKTEKFLTASGEYVDVEMMCETDYMYYVEDEGYQATQKMLDAGTFVAILPDNMDDFINNQSAEELSDVLDAICKGEREPGQETILRLPKFQFETDYRLNDSIQELGTRSIFDFGTANLSNMTDSYCCIELVRQKNILELNEIGVEGSSVTVLTECISGNPAYRKEPNVLTFDRPFLFAIYDDLGNLIFLGVKNQ